MLKMMSHENHSKGGYRVYRTLRWKTGDVHEHGQATRGDLYYNSWLLRVFLLGLTHMMQPLESSGVRAGGGY